MNPPPTTLTKKDLKSDQEVRWCPGCGDYAILELRARRDGRAWASRAKISCS